MAQDGVKSMELEQDLGFGLTLLAKPSVSREVAGELFCVGWTKHSIQATAG